MTPISLLKLIKEKSKSIAKDKERTSAYKKDLLLLLQDLFPIGNKDGIKVQSGVTRCALIQEKEDYVIKLPRYNINKFTNGIKDYCAQEVKHYQLAIQNKVSFFFAKEEPFYTLKILGKLVTFYIQEKVYPNTIELDEEDENSFSNNIIELRDSSDNTFDLPLYWVEDCIKAYGSDAFCDLSQFLEEYGINDVHEFNIGYLNGLPIIFDYAGVN